MRIFRFVAAVIKEASSGHNPGKASEELIEHRLAICESCQHYNGNACNLCGCCAGRQKSWFNKLAYETQECPIGLWREGRALESD